MATSKPITLVLKNRKGAIGSLQIETTISETYTFTSTPTKFPVEDGSIDSDHIVIDPEKIKIDGFISNTPIGNESDNYAQQAFDELYTMWQTKQLVDVDTHYLIYTDMCITNINIPRTVQTGQAIQFSVELQKIRKVNSSAANADQFQPDFIDSAPALKVWGDVAANAVDALPFLSDKQKAQIKSGAQTIVDFINLGLSGVKS